MNTCSPCRSKHAILIQNCYPRKEGETTPCSSELSYLKFYASSRPAKLTKVGSYIQKKVNSDIKKGRKENNLVSLLVLKALIQDCYGDLNIFSKYLVNIFCKLLDTKDIELIDPTCETFIVFCSYNDGSTLGIDTQFTHDYETLLEKFSFFSNYINENSSLQLKMRYIGQRGIQAAVTSQALVSSNFKRQLNILASSIMDMLTCDNTLPIQPNEAIDIRESALKNDRLNKDYLQSVAAHTLSILFSKLTALQIRISLGFIFDYISKHDKWWPSNLPVEIMTIIVESMQSQYKYIFVSEILQQLNPNDILSHKQITLISILDTIMNAETSLFGVSVLEVLNSLFILLVKVIQHDGDEQKSALIQQNLVHSIGGLASRSYYDNQLSDMTGYLVSKLKPNTSLESVDSLPIYDYRCLVLSCLDTIHSLPLDSLTHSLGLLEDNDPRIRLVYSKSLHQHLQTPQPPNTLFLQELLRSMLVWILLPNLNMTDVRFFYSFLCILNQTFGIQTMVLVISLVFKVQQSIQDKELSRQWVVESMLIAWLRKTAELLELKALEEYVDELEIPSWSLDLKMTIEDLPTVDEIKPPVWMNRSRVVEIMSSDKRLRDEHDTHGLELEARLFAEWGTEASMKNKARLIQGSNEPKPKLSSPWEHTPIDKSQDPKRDSIKVSTLKDVLVTNSEESDSTTQSSSNPSEHKPSLNDFLTELKSPTVNPTLSLVNPPYKT